MGFCSNCGKQIENGAAFCSHCGQKLAQEKTERIRPGNANKRRKIIIPTLVMIFIVAIAATVSGLVIWLTPGPNPTPYPTYTYQPQPTYTYQPTQPSSPSHQVNLVEPNHVLNSGSYSYETASIQAGSTVTISWSADANVEIWVITATQYPDWTFMAWSANYVGYKSGNSGILTCHIANTDTYYLIISRPGSGLYSPATIYSAIASW